MVVQHKNHLTESSVSSSSLSSSCDDAPSVIFVNESNNNNNRNGNTNDNGSENCYCKLKYFSGLTIIAVIATEKKQYIKNNAITIIACAHTNMMS